MRLPPSSGEAVTNDDSPASIVTATGQTNPSVLSLRAWREARAGAMKVYHGRQSEHGCAVDVEEDGERYVLHPRLDLRNHSPTGLAWGYSGSGPAQLALALAADVLGDDDKAQEIYQHLKFKLVARLPHEGWVLTETRLREAINDIEQERGHRR